MKRKRKIRKKTKKQSFNYSGSLFFAIALLVLIIAVVFTHYSKPKDQLEQTDQQLVSKVLQELNINLHKNMQNQEKVKQPAVSGGFYPDDKIDLEDTVNNFLNNAEKKNIKNIKAVIVPHAGYIFSGQIAAKSYKQVENLDIKKVFILGPSHNIHLNGVGLSSYEFFNTPLGDVKLSDINSRLVDEKYFEINDSAHETEHSLEVQLPFLQQIFTNFEIIPMVVGNISEKHAQEVAQTLQKYLDENSLLVISTDLSHYHDYEQANEIDNKTIEHIINFNSEEMVNDELCGEYPVKVLLELAKQMQWQAELIEYKNSGDVTKDTESGVVGYASIVFSEKSDEQIFTLEEKQFLLDTARSAIRKYLVKGEELSVKTENPKFLEKRGVFVTLDKDKELRGCIGYIEPVETLIEAVAKNAVSAAVNDSRFYPVTINELDEIKIEISVLTAPKKTTIDDIKTDIDGVVLEKGTNKATYLPQVWEDFTDKNAFFSSLCQKAGLEADCYKQKDIEFYKYQVEKFSE